MHYQGCTCPGVTIESILLGEYLCGQLSLEQVLLGGHARNAAPTSGVQLCEGRLPFGKVCTFGHDPPAGETLGVPQQLLVQCVWNSWKFGRLSYQKMDLD